MRGLEVLEQRTAAERLAPAVSRDLGTQLDREHRRVGMRKIEREPHGRGRFVPVSYTHLEGSWRKNTGRAR